MDTVAAKIPPKLLREVDALIREGRYSNRSELIRAAVRRFLETGGRTSAPDPAPARDAEVKRYQDLMGRLGRDPRYRNRWVAVLEGRVIDSDVDMDSLVRRVLEGAEQPVQIGFASPGGGLPVARVGVRVRRG